MSKAIYRYKSYDFRGGQLTGIFVAKQDQVAKLIGTKVYFGEVLGKHSEVVVEIEEKDIELISDNVEEVALFEKLNMTTGYNPLDYVDYHCGECGDTHDTEEEADECCPEPETYECTICGMEYEDHEEALDCENVCQEELDQEEEEAANE